MLEIGIAICYYIYVIQISFGFKYILFVNNGSRF